MAVPEPLGGRYAFVKRIRGTQRTIIWFARDHAKGLTVVASVLPSARASGLTPAVGLRHEHAAAILDVFDSPHPAEIPEDEPLGNGARVVVAEHVDGRSLQQRIDAGPVALETAVDWIATVADATSSLHERGSVHGAIQPRSLVVVRPQGATTPVLTHLLVPPSGAYCSPERVTGGGPSEADDTWALAATLYTALSRRAPFRGASRTELARAIVAAAPARLDDCDAMLWDVIERALAQDPSRRISTAAGLRDALRDWVDETGRRSAGDFAPVEAIVTYSEPAPNVGDLSLVAALVRPDSAEANAPLVVDRSPPDRPGMSPEPPFVIATAPPRPAPLTTKPPLPSPKRRVPPAARPVPRPAEPDTDPDPEADASGREPLIPTFSVAPPSGGLSPRPPAVTPSPQESATAKALADFVASPIPGVGKTPAPPPPTALAPEPAAPTPSHRDGAAPSDGVISSQSGGKTTLTAARDVGAQTESSPPGGKRRTVLGLVAFAVAAGAVFALATTAKKDHPAPAAAPVTEPKAAPAAVVAPKPAEPAMTAAEPSASAAPEVTAEPSASGAPEATSEPSASAEPAASAAPEATTAVAAGDVQACLLRTLPEGSLTTDAKVDALCKINDVWTAARRFNQEIARTGKGAGMVQWAHLARFDLAAVAVLRERCCPSPEPFAVATPPGLCESIQGAVQAVAKSPNAENADAYGAGAECLVSKGVRYPAEWWDRVAAKDARGYFDRWVASLR